MGLTAAGRLATGLLPGLGISLARSRRALATPHYTLRFGASVMNPEAERHENTGLYEFARLVEQLTEGEIAIQVFDKGGVCAERSCGERVALGVIDIGASSAQNVSAVYPYAIAPDWPFLWQSREAFLNFMFSPESNHLYRDIMRSAYGIEVFCTSCEMRCIYMGLKYALQEDIRTPAQLSGVKIRLTNSEMILACTQSLGMSPIPLAFTELLEGLKSGVVDAAETWPSAMTGFGMSRVTSQDIALDFSPGNSLIFMDSRIFDQLPGRLQDAVREAAWQTMLISYDRISQAQNTIIGNGSTPSPDSVYVQDSIRRVELSPEEKAAFIALSHVEHNPRPYDGVRRKLDTIAGFDVYGAMAEYVAREQSKPGPAGHTPLQPQRWWEAA